MYVCMYVCIYVSVHLSISIHEYMYATINTYIELHLPLSYNLLECDEFHIPALTVLIKVIASVFFGSILNNN